MSDRVRWPTVLVRALLGLLVLVLVAWASRIPLGSIPSHSALRVSLRTTAAKVEHCRDRDAAELARLPAHLRQARECETFPVGYRLDVVVDGDRRIERIVEHRGLRRSRPLIFDELLAVAPGRRVVEIRWSPVIPAVTRDGGTPAREDELQALLSELPTAVFSDVVDFTPGRLRLVVLRDQLEILP